MLKDVGRDRSVVQPQSCHLIELAKCGLFSSRQRPYCGLPGVYTWQSSSRACHSFAR